MNVDVKKLLIVALIVAARTLHAGSATWNLNPTSNDWNTAANWTPATIPNSESDVATFAVSNTTSVICADSPDGVFANTYVGGIVFAGGASAYAITITPSANVIWPSLIVFYGAGITNNSGVVQNFVTANSGTTMESGRIYFQRSSSAGENVVITNEGGAYGAPDGDYGGFTTFGYDSTDTASAGKATVINNGGMVSGAVGGFTDLFSLSKAESATFINNPGEVSGAGSGWTFIRTGGNIGSSTFIGNPATVTGAEGGWAEFDAGTAAGANFVANGATTAGPQAGQIYVYGGDGYATFTGNGGSWNGAEGGLIDLFYLPASAQTVAIAKGGTNSGLGGTILIEGAAEVGLAQFRVFGNGLLDLSRAANGIIIGSLAGDGVVSLGGYSLSIGNNNLNTTFSGVIQDSGRLVKVGTGALTLAGASTYTSGTIVSAGTLKVANTTGSATGSGPVTVKAGALAGSGSIDGVVTVGAGNGAGASLAPGLGANRLITLRTQNALTFNADATYSYRVSTKKAKADKVIANGVTIATGAQFGFEQIGRKRLTPGTVFTAISNSSANPISGTFSNLPDNSTFTSGPNKYQVSYEGASGNDLTLTAVP